MKHFFKRHRTARDVILARLGVIAALALCTHAWAALRQPQLVLAETLQGEVLGESLGDVLAFRGIPYASPPIGERRFRPPEPPVRWAGIRSALDMGPACPQLIDTDPTENNDEVMSEDCLTLNIWTPKADSGKRPVMFFIHGGAFVVGSSRNSYYNGLQLAAREGVVVVTINYRLGPWGFLDLRSFGARYAESADLGLLDQVAALRWVRDNIGNFGGDPANVTIFGESAGAASVGDLLSMPAAKGLFAKAILESGWPLRKKTYHSQNLARAYLELAGVHSAADLSARSMQDLLKAQKELFSSTTDLGTFGPSIDGVTLKKEPFDVVAQGRGSRVPLMIGTTLEEMRYFSTAEDIGIERKPRALLLSQLRNAVGARAPQLLAEYQRLYPKWGDMVVQIASDAFMRLPSIELAGAVSAYEPAYMYLLTYRSNSTYLPFGSAHAMELPFVFGTVNQPEVIVFTGRDPRRIELANRVMDMWAAFARSGDPTPPGGPKWLPYDATTRSTMELGPEIRLAHDPLREQRNAWGTTVPGFDQAWPLITVN